MVKLRGSFGYLIVLTLVLTSFMPLSLGLSCQGIFYNSVAGHIGVGVGTVSYYASIIAASCFVFMAPMGNLISRIDARLCLSGAVIFCALVFVWLSFTNSLWMYFVGAFLMGAPVSLLLYIAPSTLVNRWFAKRAGFYVGVIMAFTGIGGVVWSTVGGALIAAIGWSATYLVFAGISILTLPFTVFCMASTPEEKGRAPLGLTDTLHEGEGALAKKEEDEVYQGEGVTATEARSMPSFPLILIIAFLLNFGMYVYYVVPSYAATTDLIEVFPLLGATASSAAMAGQTISKVILGGVGERWPFKSAATACMLGVIGIACLAFGFSNVVLFYVGSFLFGVYYGVANVMLPIFTRCAFGLVEYAKIYSRISMAATAGLTITGFVWGTLVDMTGFASMFIGVSLFILFAVVLIIVLGSSRFSKKASMPS